VRRVIWGVERIPMITRWVGVALVLACRLGSGRTGGRSQVQTVTFRTEGAFLETLGAEGRPRLNVSLELRTHQDDGLLLFHQLGARGHVRLGLTDGRIGAEVETALMLNFTYSLTYLLIHSLIFTLTDFLTKGSVG
jgi:hypothetical protein